MRLSLVLRRFPSPSQTFMVSKVCGLVDAGVDVRVVCDEFDAAEWDRHPALRERPELAGRIHTTDHDRDPRALGAASLRALELVTRPRLGARYVVGRAGRRPANLPRLLRDDLLRRDPGDVVHFGFGTMLLERAALLPLLDAAVTTSIRGFDVNYKALDVPEAYAGPARHVRAVHTLGQDLWRRALARGFPPDMPVAVIPPAVDTTRFAPPERTAEPIGTPHRPARLLTIARLHWKKGIPVAVEAIRRLRDQGRDVEYRVVGDGPARDEVVEAIDRAGVGSCVTLLGRRDHEGVVELLRETDVLVHPSISEGFANAVLEAQAMAVPAVVTDADGLGENVADGVTGLVVHRRDPQQLAEAIARLLDRPDERIAMGSAGRDRVLRCFDLADQVDAFASFYDAIAAGRPPDPLDVAIPVPWDPRPVSA